MTAGAFFPGTLGTTTEFRPDCRAGAQSCVVGGHSGTNAGGGSITSQKNRVCGQTRFLRQQQGLREPGCRNPGSDFGVCEDLPIRLRRWRKSRDLRDVRDDRDSHHISFRSCPVGSARPEENRGQKRSGPPAGGPPLLVLLVRRTTRRSSRPERLRFPKARRRRRSAPYLRNPTSSR